ncbi:MAG TPA: glycosyltransferase family 4 protein [Candidatus Saccharimonadales bacterium]|nr:glycosyltransferase family 4 protein [Candidatus Saccharimonadales bacterium]
MKIIYVTPVYRPHIGGMEVVAEKIAQSSAGQGYVTEVLTSGSKLTGYGESTVSDNFHVKRFVTVPRIKPAIMPGLLADLCKQSRDTIVHLHVAQAVTPEMVFLASHIKKFPYIAHFHLDVPPSHTFGKVLLPLYKKYVLRKVLQRAKKIIVPTIDYKQLVSEKYAIADEKIEIIPNGTDHQISTKPKESVRRGKKVRLLYVGRLTAQKNIRLMLEALSEYEKSYSGLAELVIIGDGPEIPAITRIVKQLKLERSVKLKGSLYERELESEFEKADVFLLTSSHESFGIVLVEAMAKGLPIIAVNIHGVRNVVHNMRNGILVKPVPRDTAEALNKLVTDTQLFATISKYNLTDAQAYSWENIFSKLAEVYRCL